MERSGLAVFGGVDFEPFLRGAGRDFCLGFFRFRIGSGLVEGW